MFECEKAFHLQFNYCIMKSPIGMYVAQKVREIRDAKGMSRQALADCLNIAETNLRRAEDPRLTVKYNLDHLNAIAIVLKCSIADFFPKEPIVKDAKYINFSK